MNILLDCAQSAEFGVSEHPVCCVSDNWTALGNALACAAPEW